MESKLKEVKNRTVSTTVTDKVVENKKIPAGATIVSKTIRTETEKIENGWLISKNFDITYKEPGAECNSYSYYTKKWYSKTEPLEVKIGDKSLAEEFLEDE